MTDNNSPNLGRILKQRRVMIPLTLHKLGTLSGISPSHLGRIERGERFPSAAILRKLAKPLALEESELFLLAGYLSLPSTGLEERKAEYRGERLDPYVSMMLGQEPVIVQHTVLGILSILKSMANVPR